MDSGKKWLNLVLGFAAMLVLIISVIREKPLAVVILYLIAAVTFLSTSVYYFKKDKK